jgi:alpha-tubulin suppressor-like RCC1 family protein
MDTLINITLGEEVTSVACSDRHVLAVTESRQVFAWGRNEDGCLGLRNEDRLIISIPVKVTILALKATGIKGESRAMAVCTFLDSTIFSRWWRS